MRPGTAEDLQHARRDARLIPFGAAFTINADGEWKHLAGLTAVRRERGGYASREAVSMLVTDAPTHTVIAADATDLRPLGDLEQLPLTLEQP